MRIGIIVHSKTNNTYSVANKIAERLKNAGHTATVERVEPEKYTSEQNIKLKTKPDIGGYDMLVFGAPVWGFSLSPVMREYLSQLEGQRVCTASGFVTQQLPFSWMGGNRAIMQMRKLCAALEINMVKTGVVNWTNKKKDEQIEQIVTSFSAI